MDKYLTFRRWVGRRASALSLVSLGLLIAQPANAGVTNLGEALTGSIPSFTWNDGGMRSASRTVSVTMADVGGGVTIYITDAYTTSMGGVHSGSLRQVASNGSTTPTSGAVYTHNPNESGSYSGTVGAGGDSQWWWFTMNVNYWDNGTNKSDTVNFWFRSQLGGGTVPSLEATRFQHLRFNNPSAVPVKYAIVKNGTEEVQVVTVPPKTMDHVVTVEASIGDVIQPIGSLEDYVYSDGTWIGIPEAVTAFTPENASGQAYEEAWWALAAANPTLTMPPASTSGGIATPPAPTSSNSIPVNTPSYFPASVPLAGGGTPWTGTAGTADTDRLDKSTYRQGVDKLEANLKTLTAEAKKGNEHLDTLSKRGKKQEERETEAETAKGQIASKAASAKAEVENAITGARATPGIGASAHSDAAGSASSMWIVNWPGVATINLDPMSNPATAGMALFVKATLAWLSVLAFEWWLWSEFRGVFFTAATLPQARGNTVAGTGGQITGLLAAALIVAVMVSIPGVFWAAADSGLTVNLNQDILTATNASDGTKYILSILIPTGTLATIVAQMFLVRKFGIVMVGGAAALIRFFVP